MRALMLVLSEPADPSQDDAYNRWYNEKHLKDVLSLHRAVSAVRYRVAEGISFLPTVQDLPQRYVALYELDANTQTELQEFADALVGGLESGQVDISPSLNGNAISAAFLLPAGGPLSASPAPTGLAEARAH